MSDPQLPPTSAATSSSAPVVTPRPNVLKRLYAWVLSWADSPYGVPALFLIALAESSFFPIPPDVLLLGLCMGAPRRAPWFALVCTVGSVLGGVVGYGIGYLAEPFGRWIIFDLLHKGDAWAVVERIYGENAFLGVLTAAFTPIPYKVFTIAAGVFHEAVDLWTLISASVLGRGGRFYLVAMAIFWFGPPVKRLIDRYLELFTVLFLVLLVGSFFAIKWLMPH